LLGFLRLFEIFGYFGLKMITIYPPPCLCDEVCAS
jgi:hypothetical protein